MTHEQAHHPNLRTAYEKGRQQSITRRREIVVQSKGKEKHKRPAVYARCRMRSKAFGCRRLEVQRHNPVIWLDFPPALPEGRRQEQRTLNLPDNDDRSHEIRNAPLFDYTPRRLPTRQMNVLRLQAMQLISPCPMALDRLAQRGKCSVDIGLLRTGGTCVAVESSFVAGTRERRWSERTIGWRENAIGKQASSVAK